jgi:hypothetical protein
MILVTTIENKAFDLEDVSQVQLLTTGTHITGWNIFWVIFWILVFFPIAIVVLYQKLGKKYTCAIKFDKSKRVYNFDERNYNLIQLDEFERDMADD